MMEIEGCRLEEALRRHGEFCNLKSLHREREPLIIEKNKHKVD
jgi:hypothetical protein